MAENITCEAFIYSAERFADHAKVRIWAHEPYHRQMHVVIPAALGGTSAAINWANLDLVDGSHDARFTFDDDLTVTGWAVGKINYYDQPALKQQFQSLTAGRMAHA